MESRRDGRCVVEWWELVLGREVFLFFFLSLKSHRLYMYDTPLHSYILECNFAELA